MKKQFILLAVLSLFAFLSACNNAQDHLAGKWEKTDNPKVIIEFTKDGVYEIAFDGEKQTPLKYEYTPDAKESNFKVGDGTNWTIGNIIFIEENKIRVEISTPYAATSEYKRSK